MKITVLIVDDEPLARRRVRSLVHSETNAEIVGECRNGFEAVESIRAMQPSIVMLDVQMPEMDGFEVIRSLPEEMVPVVVFVTAYDQYAITAFEVNAVDYLLKPYSRSRFKVAFNRAVRRVQQRRSGRSNGKFRQQLRELGRDPEYDDRLLIKSGGRITILEVDRIDWVEAAGNYVVVHAGGRSHLLRETMGNVENRLADRGFFRIHRSSIVNSERIREVVPRSSNDYTVILADGSALTLSRRYRSTLQHLIERFN
jgi:two-component system LytT family response regulator